VPSQPRTYVYVDGFNLYYNALKGTPHKWLDLKKLSRLLLPLHDVRMIRYFTARVTAMPHDIDQPRRQETYLRALRTLPNLTIHFGSFKVYPSWLPLATPPASGSPLVKVLRPQEKGSDVNLATHLPVDAVEGAFEAAVVITNDSDLRAPIRAVMEVHKLPVGVLHPHAKPSTELHGVADFCRGIPEGALKACQFQPSLEDRTGRFRKPATW
jgi:hypothetical protein